MADVTTREFKKKYNHCKIRMKEWENKFFTLNGRHPDKADIKEADAKVKNYYKLYYKLKSAILETQILGNSFDEAVNESQNDSNTKENYSVLNITPNGEENGERNSPLDVISKNSNEVDKIMSPSDGTPKINTNDSVQNKICPTDGTPKNSEKKIPTVVTTPGSAGKRKNPEPKKWMRNASSKLFEGMSFKLRNPRKSFQKKSQNLSEISLLSDSFQSCPSPLPEEINHELSFSVEDKVSPKIKSLIESSAALSPLLGSVTKSTDWKKAEKPLHPLSILTQKSKLVRKLDTGWVERATLKAEQLLNDNRVSIDSGFESTGQNSSINELENSGIIPEHFPNASKPLAHDSSDDDLICDSDDEASSQTIQSLKRKADKLDVNTEVSEKLEIKRVKFDENSWPSSSQLPIASLKSQTKKEILENKEQLGSLKSNDSEIAKKPNIKNVKFDEYDFPSSSEPIACKTTQVKKEILQKKAQMGTLNENYIKLNMKKKIYARGKKNFNLSKHKKSEWKKKKNDLLAGGEIGGVLRCFKCGDVGHYARNCQAVKEDKLRDVTDDDVIDDCDLPSLAEAQALAQEAGLKMKSKLPVLIPQPTEDIEICPDLTEVPLAPLTTTVPPLNPSKEAIHAALAQFGHASFRAGQEAAVTRVLGGKSTLLLLGTGGGKSLCYQLPAFMYHRYTPSIALVVSPLVSLMDDQVLGSSFLKIGCLHSNQTEKQRAAVIADVKAGLLSALLVSPEAVVSCDSSSFSSVLKELPPISFACIDEVHCASQWSYNFRPSYLMLTKVLKDKLNVKTFLGLTATASAKTVESITRELGITDEGGVIQDTPLPSHIHLAVSRVTDRDAGLLELVRRSQGGAVLVYCTRRDECTRLATLIRISLRGTTVEAYHAGLPASKRKSVQRKFMQGQVQVVVATVAFGMGINKQDIRHVYHYNMPKEWENYVQEVGRAGRDGRPAYCHLLLDPRGSDVVELRRHIYSNAVDRHVLRRLLARVFLPCSCTPGTCQGHEVAFSLPDTVTCLDLPEENISTLLCYLELHESHLVKMMSPAYMTCKISSYHGSRGLRLAAKDCAPLAVALAQHGEGVPQTLQCDVIKLSRSIGWDSGMVKRHLKQTEWRRGEEGGKWSRTGVNVAFSDLGLRVCSRGDLTPEQLDEALEYLIHRVDSQQSKALNLLHSTFSTFLHFSSDFKDSDTPSRSDEIKEVIREYFATEKIPENIPIFQFKEKDVDEDMIAADVRNLVLTFRDNTFNGRAVARIMHGIQSPNYPASVWFRSRQWRAHLDIPFDRLQQIATREVLRLK